MKFILIITLLPLSLAQDFDGWQTIESPIKCKNPANRYFAAPRIDNGEVTMEECINKCDRNDKCYISIYNDLSQCVQNIFCEFTSDDHTGGFTARAKQRFKQPNDPLGRNNTLITNIGRECTGSQVLYSDPTPVERISECHDLCRSADYECGGFTIISDGLDPPGLNCTVFSSCEEQIENNMAMAYTFIETTPPTATPTISPTATPTGPPTPPTLAPTPTPTVEGETNADALVISVAVAIPVLVTVIYYLYISSAVTYSLVYVQQTFDN